VRVRNIELPRPNWSRKLRRDHKVLRTLLTDLKTVFVGTAQGLLVFSLLNQILGTGVPIPT
jgi:hypothetical protein